MEQLTVAETAELFWKLLETQSNAEANRNKPAYPHIPGELRTLLPVTRKVYRRKTAEGIDLLDTRYEFCATRAESLCRAIEWNPIEELRRGVYLAKQSFYKCISSYYAYHKAINYYQR